LEIKKKKKKKKKKRRRRKAILKETKNPLICSGWGLSCSSFLVFCVVFLFCLSSSCVYYCVPKLPVSLDCPFLIVQSIFSNVYIYICVCTVASKHLEVELLCILRKIQPTDLYRCLFQKKWFVVILNKILIWVINIVENKHIFETS
jgi:hypothetical protein